VTEYETRALTGGVGGEQNACISSSVGAAGVAVESSVDVTVIVAGSGCELSGGVGLSASASCSMMYSSLTSTIITKLHSQLCVHRPEPELSRWCSGWASDS